MEEILQLVKEAKEAATKDLQIIKLQQINRLLLTRYCLHIDKEWTVYPVEVESYFYGDHSLQDNTVHRNELQRDRFGKFYFHRKGQSASNKIVFNRSGVGICLSEGNYFYSVLIRSARINQEEKPVNGPQLFAQRLYAHLCKQIDLHTLSEEQQKALMHYEAENVVLQASPLREPTLLIHSNRIGLKENSPYRELKLRSLTDLTLSKQKEKDLASYLQDQQIEPSPEIIRHWLGYYSNRVAALAKKE